MKNRDFNDPEYIKWRKSVFKRDGFRCQMPDCRGKKLEAHHIIRWVDNPLLRYEVSNGITLCKHHHKIVTGREMDYVQMFQAILAQEHVELPLEDFFALQRKLYEDT